MKINSVKIISLLFFILSAFYLYTAYQIQVFSFDEDAPFNAKTFPIYLGYTGMFFAGLKIVLPDRKPIKVDPTNLEFKKTILLVITIIIYGATILKVGFFLSTSLFLVFSYYFLGERRWKYIIIFSFPFVGIFMYLLHGVLQVYLRDPLLKYIGIMG
ncbi:tripartite tricarboxylate transporter TctB family protein [Pelagibacterales bacterium SAG-MED05]|nr:tripartite tricarboxylate transporter TctB family protein [Pelagibacterales bacterium SAG-MED05]